MAQCSDRPGLRYIAARAGTRLNTGLRAGGSRGLSPLAPAVAEGLNIGVNVAIVAARAGVRRIALLRAGRRRHHRIVVVAQRRNRFRLRIGVGSTVERRRRLVGPHTGRGAGRLRGHFVRDLGILGLCRTVRAGERCGGSGQPGPVPHRAGIGHFLDQEGRRAADGVVAAVFVRDGHRRRPDAGVVAVSDRVLRIRDDGIAILHRDLGLVNSTITRVIEVLAGLKHDGRVIHLFRRDRQLTGRQRDFEAIRSIRLVRAFDTHDCNINKRALIGNRIRVRTGGRTVFDGDTMGSG